MAGGHSLGSVAATWVVVAALRLLAASWRVRIEGAAEPMPVSIGAVWHENWLPGVWCFRNRGIAACVSRSRDGDRVDQVLQRLGYADSVRGSSSGGGTAALRRMVQTLARGVSVVLLTDGPRGPARRSHVGAVALARLSGVPITPVAFAVRPRLRARSWDRSVLPLPFARIVCHLGAPIAVPANADPDQEERIRIELDLALARLDVVVRADLAARLRRPERSSRIRAGSGSAGRSDGEEQG